MSSRILISAYACRPGEGSEDGIGWNTSREMARSGDVWVLTQVHNRAAVEAELAREPVPNLHFVYVEPPFDLRHRSHQLHYVLWLLYAYIAARKLHRTLAFDLAHHVSFVRYWTPTPLVLLPLPFVWGPVAGHEPAPLQLVQGRAALLREVGRKIVLHLANLNPLVWISARRSAVTIACSAETAEHLARLGARDVRIMVPSPAPDDVFAMAQASPPAPHDRSELKLISVTGPGRILQWKGYHLALRGMAAAREIRSAFHIFGSGPEEPSLRALAQELGLSDRVVFWGDVSRTDMLHVMRDADALLHPASRDGGATVITEAMAFGVPTVCLDIGGPAVQVDDATGFRVPATDLSATVDGIAAAIRTLGTERGLRDAMRVACCRRAQELFTWRKRREDLAAIYGQALAGDVPEREPDVPRERRAR